LIKFYGRVKDDTVAPILPEKFAHLAKRPIVATVTKVARRGIQRDLDTEEDWQQMTTLVINKGSRQGIKEGMEFITLGRDLKSKYSFKVTKVMANTALGQHTLFIPVSVKNNREELESYIKEDAASFRTRKVRTYSLWYNIGGV
jgi:cell shape-determining protein MreC